MAGININILGVIELKWTGMGEFNSDDHYIYYCGQESLRSNGETIIVNKSPKCSIWIQSKKQQMISVRFSGKSFSITVIQIYASNAEEVEFEQFYEDLQDLLLLTRKKKRCPFIIGRGQECKSRKSRNTWGNRQIWPWSTE